MFNRIENFYRENSINIKVMKRYWTCCLLSFAILWIFYGLNFHYVYVSISVALGCIIYLKYYCEKLLKEKLFFNFDEKSGVSDNSLMIIIANKDLEIMKKYAIKNNLYSKEIINNIINHYRNLLEIKKFNISFFELFTLVITIIVPFINSNGFDIDLFIKIIPYFSTAMVILTLFYFFTKNIVHVVKILIGKSFIYTNLEEIFSELLVDMSCKCYNCNSKIGEGIMKETELDASVNGYKKIKIPKGYAKQLNWDMAIGLQKINDLKPSKYLLEISRKNVVGKLTIEELEKNLREFYTTKKKKNDINYRELECDFVSLRVVELLEKDNFELSVNYLKYIHRYLFQDVCEFAGEFRKNNFYKKEKVLNNAIVTYCDSKMLIKSLEYDIALEKEKNYKDMTIVEAIKNITAFSSSLWQVHPFRKWNTITIAIFIEKYLISLGFNVNKALFKDKTAYFRNALIRSNYFNNFLNIKEDKIYLIEFYENLLLGKNNNLHSEDLIVK